jgi:peptide/nickel transport system substrate-binding protein
VDRNPLPQDTMTVHAAEIGRYGGRFVIGATSGPKTFNALMANETSSTDVVRHVYTALTDIDYETMQDEPRLAKAWEVSPDGLTYTFHLRRGVRFSDGTPITSADVMFSFDVVMDSTLHPSMQDGLTMVVGGERVPYRYSAPDSYTFVISSPRVDGLMLAHVGSVWIMPRHKLEEAFRKGEYGSAYSTSTPPAELVASGPFRVKEHIHDQRTILERNPHYFGVDGEGKRLPYLDELVFTVAKDQDVAALRFEKGELDGLDNVKPENYAAYIEQAKGGRFVLHDIGTSFNTNFFWFNLNTVREAKDGKRVGDPHVDPVKYAWFKERDFRRAVSHAVDREALIKGPFQGFGEKNWSTMTPGNRMWFDPEIGGADHDPEESRRLLAGLGFKDSDGDGVIEDPKGNPVSFTLVTNGDNRMRVEMTNLIRDDLAKVGIKVIPTPLDFNTLVTKFRSDFTYEAALLGLGSAVPSDPGMGMNVWKSSGLTHYWNVRQPKPETPEEARIDQLMDANVATTDVAERKRTWRELMQIVNDQCWIVWLPVQKMMLPVSSRFGNVAPSPMPHRILWNAQVLFVKSGGKP